VPEEAKSHPVAVTTATRKSWRMRLLTCGDTPTNVPFPARSMGRRQVVESVNSALKGAFVDLGRGFFRVFGQVKMPVLLGFTVAGFNLDRIRSFRAKQTIDGSD
jgi:ABC-type spermidine/putrescine transport system permease subunit II